MSTDLDLQVEAPATSGLDGNSLLFGTVDGQADPRPEPIELDAVAEAVVGTVEAFTPAGTGAVSRTLQDKVRELVSVTDFGAVGDGVTDDTAAIQAAIDYAESLGGGRVYFPGGAYLISDTLVVDDDNVHLYGDGGGFYLSGTTATRDSAATRIVFDSGATPGVMLSFISVAGAHPKTGGGVKSIMLDGNDTATRCLEIKSRRSAVFEDVVCFRATAEMIWMGAISGPLLSSPYDTQFCLFKNVLTTAVNVAGNTAYGLVMTGGQGNGAASSGNSSFNTFIDCFFTTRDQVPIVLEDADSNEFYACKTRADTGTHYAVVLSSSDQNSSGNADLGYARYNQFWGGEYVGGVHARASQTGDNSSHDNVFHGYSLGNSAAGLTLETGAGGADNARCQFQTTRAFNRLRAVKGAFSDTAANIEAVLEAIGNATARISNSASDHMRLVHSGNSAEWGINVDGSLGNLRFQRTAGTGVVALVDATTAFQDNVDTTKQLQFQLSGITTGTTRTLTPPDASGTLALLALAQSWTASQTFTLPIIRTEQATIPSTPSAGTQASFVDASGRQWALLPSGRLLLLGTAQGRRMGYSTGNNSTTIDKFGAATATSDGTATAITIASTNIFTRTMRIQNISAASAGANCGHRFSDFRYLADAGHAVIRFGFEDFQPDCAAFVGLKGSAAHGDADPSSFLNCIGIGIDSGQTTWRLLNNDGSGAATAADLGANFPANTDATDLYELLLWWGPAATSVNYQVTRLNTGDLVKGTISTNLPATTQVLNSHVIGNTRTGSAALSISWSQVFGETA